jgi:hypothetical protein
VDSQVANNILRLNLLRFYYPSIGLIVSRHPVLYSFAVSFRGRFDLLVLESRGQASLEVTSRRAPLDFPTATSTTLTKTVKTLKTVARSNARPGASVLGAVLYSVLSHQENLLPPCLFEGSNERPTSSIARKKGAHKRPKTVTVFTSGAHDST